MTNETKQIVFSGLVVNGGMIGGLYISSLVLPRVGFSLFNMFVSSLLTVAPIMVGIVVIGRKYQNQKP